MSATTQDALSSVMDRCAQHAAEPEPSFYGRTPEEVQSRRDLKPGPKHLVGVLDRVSRGKAETDPTDAQLADACGVSVNTIYRWLAKLELVGLIERVNRTCRRVIRLLFRFRTASTSPKSGGSPLPPKVGETPPNFEGNSPQNRGELPPSSGDTSKEERKKGLRARPSSSSPAKGDTPTAAKDGEDTPPTSARPPLDELAVDVERMERWESLTDSARSEIGEKVAAGHPGVSRFPAFFRALCFEEMERIYPRPQSQRVEVLPTDEKLGSLKDMAFSGDPLLRGLARHRLSQLGRDDIFQGGFEKAGTAGQPPRGLPAVRK